MTNEELREIDKSEAIAFALFHKGKVKDMEEAREIYIKEYVDNMRSPYFGAGINGTEKGNAIIAAEKWERQKEEIAKRLNSNWGGARAGAGRKKSENPKILWGVKVTPEEKEYLKKCLTEYRAANK